MKSINRSELTPRGEKVFHAYDATKDIGKKALIASVVVGSTSVMAAAAYDTLGPHEVVKSATVDIGDYPSAEGDVGVITDELIEMGEDPNSLSGAGREAQDARAEAEKAHTTIGTIVIKESPLFNRKKVKINFPKED